MRFRLKLRPSLRGPASGVGIRSGTASRSIKESEVKSRALVVLLLLGAPSLVAGQLIGPNDFDYPPLPYEARFFYGPDSLQHADLRLPDGPGPHPVAVVLHGGCWQGWHRYRHIERVAEALTSAGWATWNLAHRQAVDSGGGWPGTFDDVAGGTDFLREAAQEYPLDLNTVVTIGHSAGGHLALWVAARPRIPEGSELYSATPLPIAGVVSLAGIPDLRTHFEQEPGPSGERSCGDGVTLLLGGTPASVPERYRQASPAALLPLGVPQLLLHGVEDLGIPVAQVEAYAQRARSSGDSVRLVTIPNAGHFELMAPTSSTWESSVKAPLLEFLSDVQARSRQP